MTEERVWSIPNIRLQAARQDQPPPDLAAAFVFAPETPTVGQPGAQPGDLVVQARPEGGYTVLVSLGKSGSCTAEAIRKAGGGLGKWLAGSGADRIAVDLNSLQACGMDSAAQALLEGLVLGGYRFRRYKKPDASAVEEITVTLSGGQEMEALAARVQAITSAVILARNLAHEPANSINPVTLAERAREVAAQAGISARVLDENALRELGAGAILGVGKGSKTPPRLIVMEYPGKNAPQDARPVVLVGKAITFDTGGYSLKGTENIVGMKYDKCGGIAVLAVMQTLAALEIHTPVIGIISAAENMISGDAYRPDDILTTLNGKTVEIISTDAEGRLVLADALTYAQREYQPRALIDLATLTGGVVVALGRVRAGLLSNDDELAAALSKAGETTFERLWRLPLDEDYSRNIKGDDADLKNSGGREGHCILGGAFLQEFIEDGTPWAHLDIAGVADTPKDLPYASKGATGFGVRLLIEYLESLQ